MRECRLLTSAQVCERLGNISRVTLFRWRKTPELGFPAPARTINRLHYWDEDQIDDFSSGLPREDAA